MIFFYHVVNNEKIYDDIVKYKAIISKLHKLHVFPYYDPDRQNEHF